MLRSLEKKKNQTQGILLNEPQKEIKLDLVGNK